MIKLYGSCFPPLYEPMAAEALPVIPANKWNKKSRLGVSSSARRHRGNVLLKERRSRMFCSRCGQSIGSQPQCPNCGAPTGVVSILPVSRVAKHLQTIGILWTVFAVYSVLRWVVVLPVLHVVLGGRTPWMPGPDTWVYPFHPGGWLLHLITVLVLARAILSLAVGIALLTRQPWGRIFAIIIAVLTLIKPLLGTALAIYTLWVFFGNNADRDYSQIAESRLSR